MDTWVTKQTQLNSSSPDFRRLVLVSSSVFHFQNSPPHFCLLGRSQGCRRQLTITRAHYYVAKGPIKTCSRPSGLYCSAWSFNVVILDPTYLSPCWKINHNVLVEDNHNVISSLASTADDYSTFEKLNPIGCSLPSETLLLSAFIGDYRWYKWLY